MYTQFRRVKAEDCLVLPEDTTAAQGASCFVNPLTALGMVETMRREGHSALVHTAAASSLGRMLNRLCVRGQHRPGQHRSQGGAGGHPRGRGAVHVCDSSSPTFIQDLTQALASNRRHHRLRRHRRRRVGRADPVVHGGRVEPDAKGYSVYGSTTHKQVYLYGRLDTGPTKFTRNFGAAWGMGGWLLFPFLQKIGPAADATIEGTGRPRSEDDVRQPVLEGNLAGAGTAAGSDMPPTPSMPPARST